MKANILRSLAVAALLAAAVSGCTKSSDTASSGASPSATATMTYTGSTDTSNGSAMATPAAAKVVAGDPAHGQQVFSQNCQSCHGAGGVGGGVGPSLKGEKARKDLAATVAWIKNPQPPMPKLYPGTLDEKDVADVATYVESL